jgi:hypothetical protein
LNHRRYECTRSKSLKWRARESHQGLPQCLPSERPQAVRQQDHPKEEQTTSASKRNGRPDHFDPFSCCITRAIFIAGLQFSKRVEPICPPSGES